MISRKFFTFLLYIALNIYIFGQVQLSQENEGSPNLPPSSSISNFPVVPSDSNTEVPTEEFDSGFSPLTDPEELLLIEGLDEPMERLKLRDQDTNMILDMIQMITGRHILRPQNLPAVKVTFDSISILSKRETLLAVESLLAMNGIGITKIDDRFYKAVPASGMNIHVPIWLDAPASTLRPSQRIYMKMFKLNYAPALEVREQLNAFATPNVGSLLLFEKSNSILITDSLLNLQRMEEIIDKIDKPVRPEDLNVLIIDKPLRNSDAKTVKAKLDGMIQNSLKPFLGGTTAVEIDERTNSIIVITKAENNATITRFLAFLDKELENENRDEEVFQLKHADATEIHRILIEVITKNVQITKDKERDPGNQRGNDKPPARADTEKDTVELKSDTKNADAEIDEAATFSDEIVVSLFERSNSILVYGTKGDLKLIKRLIDKLDKPLPLARIDTIFVMVDLSQQNQRGIDALFGGLKWNDDSSVETQTVTNPGPDGLPGTADDTSETISTNIAAKALEGTLKIPGLNSAASFQLQNWNLKQVAWDQIFSLASERNDVRIFSTPSIMVSHNAESVHIKIEDERSVVIPSFYGNVNTTDTSNTGNREKILATTELEIMRPKIGLSSVNENNEIAPGSIFMEVKVKAEKFDETQSNTYQGQNIPGRKVREARSLVSVFDGEIIVLGGLQEVQLDTTESRYNLLSDIPILGEKFFRPKKVSYTPTELMIFMRPTIIDPVAQLKSLTSVKNLKEETQDNHNKFNNDYIDRMLKPEYTPRFKSPSGKFLGDPNIQQKESVQDEKSSLPVLN
ncbi:MAG: secretin N-terminal domain-containing protein [Verrucomicrobiota bacterium]|nr:secretin N-terminal domain-containing protein [Verrucomicrobiota bacterium]